MSIEFTCPHCDSILRVEDANAGKRARCPHCAVINRVPGELIDTTPPAPVSHQFFIDSVSGQTFGPITKSDLDSWVSEGRVSASCVIRATGQPQGQPASVYYPELAHQSASSSVADASTGNATQFSPPQKQPVDNPYAAPPSGTPSAIAKPTGYQPITSDQISPVRIELGDVFSYGYQLFTQNMGLLVGAAVVCAAPQLLANLIEIAAEDRNGNVGPFAVLLILALNFVQTYLVIGQLRISLLLARGHQAEFSELFSGGDKFLPVLGFSILVFIPLCIGFLLLIVPGIYMILFYWPCYSLIVDRKATVFESFGIASRIGQVNLLNSFVLGLASFGIVCLGVMACCVGVIFASGFVSVLGAVAYLLMSGQVRLQPIN